MRRLTKTLLAAALLVLMLGFAEAQACGAQSTATSLFGTKVQAGDQDMGISLSNFGPINPPGPTTSQLNAYISYWDIGVTPTVYDDKDIVYLQFGGVNTGPNRIAREGNIRLTGWGTYVPGSKVRAGDSDIGQQLLPWAGTPLQNQYQSGALTGFYYMDVSGGPGYDLDDPLYLKLTAPPATTNTNDIRITPFAGFPAGSKVSLADSDAARPLNAFFRGPPALFGAAGGPKPAFSAMPPHIAKLGFFNANGNTNQFGVPIYDEEDLVYFDIQPIGIVSPNDVRLFA